MTSLAKVNLWARFQNTENYGIKLYNTSKTNYQKQKWVQGAEEIECYVYKACTPSQFDVTEDKRSAPAEQDNQEQADPLDYITLYLLLINLIMKLVKINFNSWEYQ